MRQVPPAADKKVIKHSTHVFIIYYLVRTICCEIFRAKQMSLLYNTRLVFEQCNLAYSLNVHVWNLIRDVNSDRDNDRVLN